MPHLIVGAAALAAAVTGYGFVVLSAPFLAFVVPPHSVVPLALILGWLLITALLVRPDVRRAIDRRLAVQLALTGVLGTPAGVWLLTAMDSHTLRVTLGLVSATFALATLSGFRLRPGTAPPPYVVGFVSGIFSGCVGLSGPPLAMYLASREVSNATFRATAGAVVWVLSAATLTQLALAGQLPAELSAGVLSLLPALAAGGLVGARLFPLVPVTRFRQAALGLAALAGLVTAMTGALARFGAAL